MLQIMQLRQASVHPSSRLHAPLFRPSALLLPCCRAARMQHEYYLLDFSNPERQAVFQSMAAWPCVAQTNEYFAYKEAEAGVPIPVPMEYCTMPMCADAIREPQLVAWLASRPYRLAPECEQSFVGECSMYVQHKTGSTLPPVVASWPSVAPDDYKVGCMVAWLHSHFINNTYSCIMWCRLETLCSTDWHALTRSHTSECCNVVVLVPATWLCGPSLARRTQCSSMDCMQSHAGMAACTV